MSIAPPAALGVVLPAAVELAPLLGVLELVDELSEPQPAAASAAAVATASTDDHERLRDMVHLLFSS
jgi:hypothetical protein